MSKLKILNLINYIAIGIAMIVDFVLGIVFKFDNRFFFSTTLMLAGIGVFDLIFILIKEICILEYDSNRFIPILHASHVVIGVLGYYLIEYLKAYERFWYLYWIGLIVLFGFSFVLYYLLEKNNKNNNKNGGPKFAVNKNR